MCLRFPFSWPGKFEPVQNRAEVTFFSDEGCAADPAPPGWRNDRNREIRREEKGRMVKRNNVDMVALRFDVHLIRLDSTQGHVLALLAELFAP